MDVQLLFLNRLEIFENNKLLTRFSSPFDPDFRESTETAYTSEDGTPPSEELRIERVYIRAPKNGWGLGQTNTYTFRAASLNPDYNDKPQQYASIDLPVVVVASLSDYPCPQPGGPITGSSSPPECQLEYFSAQDAVKKGEVVTLEWRILNCAKAQLLENGSILLELMPQSGQKSIIGSAPIKIEKPTTFELRSVNSSGSRKLGEKYVNISACAGGNDPKQFLFCVQCPGGLPQPSYTNACTEQEAKQGIESQYGGCTVKAGACTQP